MPKFRKKPVVIDATQYTEYGQQIDGMTYITPLGTVQYEEAWTPKEPHIHTLEGWMRVSLGDWVITGVQNEKYPCKNDIFEKTYEPVEDEELDPESIGPWNN